MNRRDTGLALLALGATIGPLNSLAQQQGRVWRVGFLAQRSRPVSVELDSYGGFLRGMRALGYVEGTNLVVEWRFADGRSERLPDLAAELVQLKVYVIVVAGTPATRAAQNATATIPIVMGAVADPVGSGFVASLARPGGNITGLSLSLVDISAKHLEMLLSAVPKLSRLAVLVHPANSSHTAVLNSVQAAAQQVGISVVPVEAGTPEDLENAFFTIARERAGAIIVATDPFFVQQRRQIVELAAKNRLPSISGYSEYAKDGGLIAYGQSFTENYRRAATYVDKILKGARPGDLPIEQPTTFELVVNLKTAKAIGLTIPQPLLVRADEVIQ